MIAFFDFDNTITSRDSMLMFIRFVVGDIKFFTGLLVLSPIFILYKVKMISNQKAKQIMMVWFFKGFCQKLFQDMAREYSLHYIDKIVREKAMERLRWHKVEGHRVVIVSASIETWLRPWCEKNEVDLLCTQLEFKDNTVTGQLRTPNCYGKEKVNRIQKAYALNEYERIYAYGDSRGDKEMLELADESYYRPWN